MSELKEVHLIRTEREAQEQAKKLPSWVKCMYCGGRPTDEDYLGEVVPNSSALAHQSCMKSRGKVFGMNVGVIPNLGEKKP